MIEDFVLVIILVSQERVVVDLQEPDSEVLVYKEIVAAQLEAMFSLFQIDPVFARQYCINHDIFHSWQKVFFYGDVVFAVLFVQIFLEDLKRHGIALLMLAESRFLLDL